MKAVLVTGGTGFIGRALTRALRARMPSGGSVVSIGSRDVDLTDRASAAPWFERIRSEHDFDHIFHLAAVYKAGGWPVDHPATQFFANMSINVNLLEGWTRKFPKAKLTSVLSYCMYPPHDRPHPETELWGTEPEEYLYSYGMTKKALLVGHKACAHEYGARCTTVVLPTVYGPDGGFEENSHVMGALIGKFVRARRKGLPQVEVWGDGSQEREFIYIDDVVDGILAAALRTDALVHNLGAGGVHSVREIAETIKKVSGYPGEIRYNSDRFVGVRKRQLDSSLILRNLGWKATTPLHEGIRKTVEWYERHLDSKGPGAPRD